jgi:hypothetical protein
VTSWEQAERMAREQAYDTIDADPQVLLEQDSWFDVDADLIYARLLGFEGEIVRDGWRLPKVTPEIRMPIVRSTRALFREAADEAFLNRAGIIDVDLLMPTVRTAVYRLQSGFATIRVSGQFRPPVEQLRDDDTAVLAYLRYRRRA